MVLTFTEQEYFFAEQKLFFSEEKEKKTRANVNTLARIIFNSRGNNL